MTRYDQIARSEECLQLAARTSDPIRKDIMKRMGDLWRGLADAQGRYGGKLDIEYRELLQMHASIISWDRAYADILDVLPDRQLH